MKCEMCGKSAMFGENVSHSKQHTNRRFDPNAHTATVILDGKPKKMHLCTRCIRAQNKSRT